MKSLIFISIVFVLIAQASGMVAYYSNRNQYSKSAQNAATFLPAVVFVLLTVLGALSWLLLAWWVEVAGLRNWLLAGNPPLLVWAGGYVVGGVIANIFLSILVQLGILVIHPPKYKPRRRRRSESSNAILSGESPSLGS